MTNASADLVTFAQAAHWFDLDSFYAECRRVLVPGGLVALLTYGVTAAPDPSRTRLDAFYWQELDEWWPSEVMHTATSYADMRFPFTPVDAPQCGIERTWSCDQLLGFVST